MLVPPIHYLSRIFHSETANNNTNTTLILAGFTENVVGSYTSIGEFHLNTRYSQLVEVRARFCNSHRLFFVVFVVVSGLKHFLMTSEMR